MNYIPQKGLPSAKCVKEETPKSKQGKDNNYSNYKAKVGNQRTTTTNPIS